MPHIGRPIQFHPPLGHRRAASDRETGQDYLPEGLEKSIALGGPEASAQAFRNARMVTEIRPPRQRAK